MKKSNRMKEMKEIKEIKEMKKIKKMKKMKNMKKPKRSNRLRENSSMKPTKKINTHTSRAALKSLTVSGKVIGSGSYGCVFKPPIKCANKTRNKTGNKTGNKKGTKKISKLMLLEEAEDEYYKHQKIKKILSKIKNSENYFLFSDSLCLPKDLPAKLSARDRKSMEEDCNSERITESYQEDGFSDLAMLTMDDGGIDLENYIIHFSREQNKPVIVIKEIAKHLHNLLLNAIIPMNKLNVYHTDIKPANIVVQTIKTKIQHLKLIDWGLSKINIPDKQRFSFLIHFNYPYESLLFGLSDKYNSVTELNQDIKNIIKEDTEEDTINPHIMDDIILLFGNTETKYTKKMVVDLLTNYLISIARQCYNEKTGLFDRDMLTKNYFNKIDLWGFMICFIQLYKISARNTNEVVKSYLLNICHYVTTYKYNKSGKMDMNWIHIWSKKIEDLYKIEIKD